MNDTTTALRGLVLPSRLGTLQRVFETLLIPVLWAASFATLVVVAIWF